MFAQKCTKLTVGIFSDGEKYNYKKCTHVEVATDNFSVTQKILPHRHTGHPPVLNMVTRLILKYLVLLYNTHCWLLVLKIWEICVLHTNNSIYINRRFSTDVQLFSEKLFFDIIFSKSLKWPSGSNLIIFNLSERRFIDAIGNGRIVRKCRQNILRFDQGPLIETE